MASGLYNRQKKMELHETVMGKRLIERTLPKMTDALDRIANAMERKETDCYIVAFHYYNNEEAMNEVNSERTHDKWVVHESLEEAQKQYREVLKHPLIRSAAITRIIEGTDWSLPMEDN